MTVVDQQLSIEPETAIDSEAGRATRKRRPWRLIGWGAFAAGMAVLMLLPLFQLQRRAFEDPSGTYDRATSLPQFGNTLFNTALLAIGSLVIALVLGTLLAWWISRVPPKIRFFLAPLPLAPLIIPPVAFVVGWTFLMSPRVGYINQLLRKLPWWSSLDSGPLDPFTLPMIIVISGLILAPFVYLFVLSALGNLSGEFEAAARVSGATERRAFFTVTLPLIRPALVYSSGVVLLLGLGQFTVPLLLGRTKRINVLTTEMYLLRERFPIDYSLAAMLGVPLLVVGIVVIAAQYRAIGDTRRFVTLTGRTGGTPRQKGSRWTYLPIGIFAFGAVIAPLIALVYVAASPFWSGQLGVSDLTLRHVRTVLEDPVTATAVMRSIRLSAIAAAIVLPIGFFAALAIQGRIAVPRGLRVLIEVLSMIPLGIPAAVMGLGILFAYTVEPFGLYGSETVVIIAYVTVMVPFATRTLLATLVSIGPEYVEASRTSGAGSIRTIGMILVPLARRGIAGAGALLVILLFHEFAATVMVDGLNSSLMSTVLYKHWTDGSLPRVAVVALIMVVVTTIGVMIALAAGGVGTLQRRLKTREEHS
jgi:iron(III) transport system permease protein